MKFFFAMLLSVLTTGCITTRASADYNLQGMAAALIQHQLSIRTTYLRQNSAQKFFVSVGTEDLSATTRARLSVHGVTTLPGSAWHEGSGMRLGIGMPTLRPDGDFDVSFSYYCGIRCTSVHQAVMSKGEHGWVVISSTMVLISLSPARGRPTLRASA